jgi:glycopeptide antibiotics resistance protein
MTLALLAFAAIAAILLMPAHPDHWVVDPLTDLIPASLPQVRLAVWWALEDLGNIALFVPVGVVIARKVRAPWAPVALGLVFSLAAEAAQSSIAGRVPSLPDVLLNAVGAACGAACMHAWKRWRAPAAPRGVRIVAAVP